MQVSRLTTTPQSSLCPEPWCITMPGGAVKYGGITRDAEVAISDDAGDAVLQTTKLSGGTFGSNGSCVFTFTTSVPSGTHLYDIKVGLGRDAPAFKFTESRTPDIGGSRFDHGCCLATVSVPPGRSRRSGM